MGSKGTTTTQTQNQAWGPTQQAADLYGNILGQAQGVAATPYQAYGGELTAGINQQQQLGINNINAASGVANPYLAQAQTYANQGAAPITAGQIQNYANPYQQQVVQATMGNINETNAQQQQQVVGNAAMKGALGGDRVGVAQSELARQQNLSNNSTLAGLNQAGYQSALSAAQQDRASAGQAAYTFGNLGQLAQNTALTGAGAQLGAGTLQQQTQQSADTAAYQQYMQKLAFPYQQTQWLAGIGTGVGSQLGGWSTGEGTSTQEGGGNPWGQGIGAALSLAAMIPSDERVKEDVTPVGKTFDGQDIYRYRYKGSPAYQMGLLAQEVEKTSPEAVGETADGMKAVNYKTATDDAAERRGFADGGLAGGSPYGAGMGYVPVAQMPVAQAMQRPELMKFASPSKPEGGSDIGKMIGQAGGLAKNWMKDKPGTPLDISPEGMKPTPTGVGEIMPSASEFANPAGFLGGLYANGGLVTAPGGYANGGAPDTFNDRWDDFPVTQGGQPAGSLDAAKGLITQATGPDPAVQAWRDDNPLPGFAQAADPRMVPPEQVAAAPSIVPDQPTALNPTGGVGGLGASDDAAVDDGDELPPNAAPAQYAGDRQKTPDGLFGLLPGEFRAPMLAAGLSMLASKSKNIGQSIGEGGLAGLGTYQKQREADRKQQHDLQSNAIQSRRLDQAAEQAQKTLEYRTKVLAETTRQHDLQVGKPFVIGSDFNGPVYGVRDPKTGAITPIDPKTGQPRSMNGVTPQPGAQSQPAPVNTPEANSQPPAAIPSPAKGVQVASNDPFGVMGDNGGHAAGTNPSVLSGLDPKEAGLVKAVAEGRVNPASIPQRNRNAVMQYVNAYDKDYDQNVYSARKKMRDDLTTGTTGKLMLAYNQLMPHLATASEKAMKLDNSNYPAANSIRNWWLTNTGDPRVKDFATVREVAAMDAARLLRGVGAMAEADINAWRKNIAEAGSPRQLMAVIKTLSDDLMSARVTSIEHQWRSTMKSEPPDIVSPEAKGALRAIHGYASRVEGGGNGAKPSAAAPSGGSIPVGTEKPFNQGGQKVIGVWDGSKWNPKQ